MSSTTYAPVDGATLAATLAALPAISAKLGGEPADWRIREVGDGNLNLVFIVEGPAGGVVVKQALPYVRMVGDSWPLPLERSWFEYNALIEQAKYAPGLTPQVFHFDRAQAMIVMEYLSPHVIMRKGLIRGVEYPKFAADIAEFLARHAIQHLGARRFGGRAQGARSRSLRPIPPYARSPRILSSPIPIARRRSTAGRGPGSTRRSRRSSAIRALKIAAQARKYQFMTSAQALMHGDLHTGSIMLTTADTRVIDPEFAFVGPIGFDVGAVIGNLLHRLFRARRPRGCAGRSATPIGSGSSIRSRRYGRAFTTASWRSGAMRARGTPMSRASLFQRTTAARWKPSSSGSCASCLKTASPSPD